MSSGSGWVLDERSRTALDLRHRSAVFAAPEVGVEGVFEAGDGGEAAPAVAVEDVEDGSGAGSGPVGYLAECLVALGGSEPLCYCLGEMGLWWGVGVVGVRRARFRRR